MSGVRINADMAAENIVERLNAHERAMRWRGGGSEGVAVEDITRAADHYSPAGTQILRDHHGIDRAFVVHDGERGNAVVYEEPGEAEVIHRRRLRRWIRDAPVRSYEEWRARGTQHVGTPVESEDASSSYARIHLAPKIYRRIEIGRGHEFIRWLQRVPIASYGREPEGWWYIAADVRGYVVDPRFHEAMSYQDIVGDMENHYPLPPADEPFFHLDVFSGSVGFTNPVAALRYARDLGRAMGEQGVLCSPNVGIRGYTDRVDVAGQDADGQADVGDERGGLPTLTGHETEAMIGDLLAAESRIRRRKELERRLEDPRIPDRRKAQIKERLREARELEAAMLEGLADVPRATFYGLALEVTRQRDQLSQAKDLSDTLLLIREEELRRAMGHL